MSHYLLLGVSPTASPAEISSAYRAKAIHYHPDKQHGKHATPQQRKENEQRYAEIQQAYHVLRHDEARRQYDDALKGQSAYDAASIRVQCQCGTYSSLNLTTLPHGSFLHCFSFVVPICSVYVSVCYVLACGFSSSGVLSFSEVDLDDCAYDESTGIYSHPCRCGAHYTVDEATLIETGVDLFTCEQCSLVLRILFEWQPAEAEEETTTDAKENTEPQQIRPDEME